MKKSDKLLSFGLRFTVLYVLWGFIFSNTIIASYILDDICLATMLFFSTMLFIRYISNKIPIIASMWCPYLLYTILGLLLGGNYTTAILWVVAIVLVCIGARSDLICAFPIKIIYWSGLLAAIGVLFQLFFPTFYYTRVSPFFVNFDQIEDWENRYGIAGITSQVGITAYLIVYGEIILLYMREKVLPKTLNHILLYIIFTLMIVCIFLTGKRTMAMISIVLPIILYILSTKVSGKKIITISLIFIAGYVSANYFMSHLNEYEDSYVLRRFVSSYNDIREGEDITSGRTILYAMALRAFHDSPVFGIGVANFRNYTGADTNVHNSYLQILCEQGVFGLVLYIIPLLYTFTYSIRLIKKIRRTNLLPYLYVSIAFQLVHILYALTGNVTVDKILILYFLSVSIVINVESMIEDKTCRTF